MRTRFAPSPTGYIHLGALRTALFGYLLAKKMGGVFVLRIEDTDQERLVADAAEKIYEALRIAGIAYDEGPDVGGDYGPYVQSMRKSDYLKYAKQLVANGAAYHCFCDKARLDDLPEGYDRHCLALPPETIEKNLAQGAPYVIRQLIPKGHTTFVDQVFGEITVDNAELEDQVLIKSDGMPTYNFANVVDDHLMKITHVIRGSEFLTSTPKYNLLYQALGWDIPTYIHLPLILREGGGKLSKRHGDAFFEDFLAKGFLPEAVVNYVVLLGWSPPDNREIYSLTELAQIFSIDGISKSPSAFDMAKLRWVNGEYLKAMDFDRFYRLAEGHMANAVKKPDVDRVALAKMVQSRVAALDDIPEMLDFIDTLPDYDTALYIHKKSKCDEAIARDMLGKIAPKLAELAENSWNGSDLYKFLTDFAENAGLKNSQVLWPMRVALSGKAATPGGSSDLLAILGKTESVCRIETALEKLGARQP
ncbi:MAG: glutamate--tRNA ligase [Clostridiales bacterium]|jgi:glutamyl-tRNA synthetase|nr:glutamate--tRNA ligase [Clostridiales bacterium]